MMGRRRIRVRVAWVAAAALGCLSMAIASAAPAANASVDPFAASVSAVGHQLWGVSCASAKDCVAVVAGPDLSAPALETWNGAKWTYMVLKQESRSTSSSLEGVSCRSATNCLAVGDGYTGSEDVALAYSGRGRTWTPRVPPASVAGLQSVSCTAVECVALGFNAKNAMVVGLWGGSTWKAATPPQTKGSVNYSLSAISCVKPRGCVAVGGANLNDNGYPVADTWTGSKWTAAKLPQPAGSGNGSLFAVSCLSLTKCFAVGGSETEKGVPVNFVDELNGTRWTSLKLSTGSYRALVGISCASAKNCLAVGTNGGTIIVDTGRAYAEAWNGKTWKSLTVPAPPHGAGTANGSEFTDVDCLTSTDCMAVGLAGPTGSSTDFGFSGTWNGRTWKYADAA